MPSGSSLAATADDIRRASQRAADQAELAGQLLDVAANLQTLGVSLGEHGRVDPSAALHQLARLSTITAHLKGLELGDEMPVVRLAADHIRRLPLNTRANFLLELIHAADQITLEQFGRDAAHNMAAELVRPLCQRYEWGGWSK